MPPRRDGARWKGDYDVQVPPTSEPKVVPMTGEEHYRQSQRLLRLAQKTSEQVANMTVADHGGVAKLMDTLLLQAQVHATLALAAATARSFALPGEFGKAELPDREG